MRFFSRLVAAVFAASLILPAALIAPVSAAAATHLSFLALPANVTAGVDTVVTVRALDGTNAVDTGYTGTVTLTTGDISDTVTSSPHVYVGADAGTFDFHVTFGTVGARTLAASDGVITSASGGTTVVFGAANHLLWIIDPGLGTVTGGTPFANQPRIEVRDIKNNLVTNSSASVQVAIASWATGAAGGVLTGPATVAGVATHAAVSGVATFSGLSIDKASVESTVPSVIQDNVYRLNATSVGLSSDASGEFPVVVGPATHLVYGQAPSNGIQGVAISPAVTVAVQDAGGNRVTTDTSNVHVAIGVNPSGGTLAGTATVAAAAGLATFSNLSINFAGVGYTLAATDGALTGVTSGAFNITPQPNHAPSGVDKTITINEDASYTFTTADFGFTDASDAPPNTLLTVKITTVPAGGALKDNGVVVTAGTLVPVADITGSKLVYTPAANANGAGYGTFTFQVQDNGGTANGGGNLDPSPNTVTVNVTAVNDAPVAVADTVVVKQGTTLTTTASTGVLANDSDAENTALTAVLDATTTHGALVLNSNGSYTYTPTGSYVGADSFTYHASDGSLSSSVVTVSISVYVNHAPVAVADSKNILSGSPATVVDVLANDNAANPDTGETLTITAVGHAAHGTVSITAGGASVKYQPKSTFLGTDHFTYTISDGQLTATATVTIHVIKDKVKPTTTAPVQTILAQKIGTSTVVVHVAWTGADVGSGVAKYQLQQSKNGGSFKTVSLSSKLSRSSNRTLTVSSSYRFRVRAVDKRGNVGAWTYGPAFKVLRFQETSVTFAGTWAARSSSAYSGGKDRSTSETGASATFTTTGRTFSWVAVRGTARGTAQVFVDGVLARTLDLHLSSTRYRYVVFSTTLTSATHSIRVVFTGAAPKLIDVDGFIVLR